MAAAYGTRQMKQLRRCVALCRLLLVAVLLLIGNIAVADAGAGSPRTDVDEAVAFQAAGQLQRFRRWGGEAPTTTAAAAGGWPALNKEPHQQTAAGGRRRMLVGSRAPTCTYNECRGCRHRCSVQEVPIDASDPINDSAYHYKCICHL